MSMIFDSERIAEVRQKYESVSDYLAPAIVLLDRLPSLAAERRYLERALQCATGARQRDWLTRLLSEDDGQHLGAWFEMMLHGWLQKLGRVEIQPEIEGNHPDFAITASQQCIVVEAKALAMGHEERRYERYVGELLSLLRASPEPYELNIAEFAPGVLPPGEELVGEMLRQLEQAGSAPAQPAFPDEDALGLAGDLEVRLRAVDRHRNEVTFVGSRNEALPRMHVSHAGQRFKNASRVWAALGDKALRHGAVRSAGHPYIIALFVESIRLPVERAIESWFGRLQAVLFQGSGGIVDVEWDRSGLQFRGQDILHRDVSGTLFFEARPNHEKQCRDLKVWWIQNPYATVPLKACLPQTEGRLVVLSQGPGGYRLGWAGRPGPGIWLPPDRSVTGP